MGSEEEEWEFNHTEYIIPLLKSNPKKSFHAPELDNIVERHNGGIAEEPTDRDRDMSSIYMIIFIPVATVLFVIILAAALRWRYTVRNQGTPSGKCQHTENNNINVLIKAEEGSTEDGILLKTRNISVSSSNSSVNRSSIGGITGVITTMRIIPDTNKQEILKSSRTDLYCELSPDVKESDKTVFQEENETVTDSAKTENEVLKERSSVNNSEKNTKSVVVFNPENSREEDIALKRPNTLKVLPIVERTANANCSKGFAWAEQLWTPDADIIYEETVSPENICTLGKERRDHIFPLMAKGRFKMKPKGLLERRGSNVALTISLKNEEKACASPPPTSKSPKPLVYLRTASAKLDPIQLQLKALDTTKLQEEFWEVPMNHPSEKHFSIPGYGTKNRYRSILPNPHSRVLLPASQRGDPLSAYINANYVRGYSAIIESDRRRQSEEGKENESRRMSIKRKAGFIATQGPMANTIVDFWKMVWQENANAVVMITKLKERKEKCSEYMPLSLGEVQTYENFQIKVKHVRCADHFSVRTVEVRNDDEDGEIRTISHYWYSEWLDHDTPDKLRGLLTLIQEVDTKSPELSNSDHGPVIVHCSAGIGRTGCFIAISVGCRELKLEGKVDILKIICQLRMDRGGMIQTWEQYQYVHVALSRYARILAGENVDTPLTSSSSRTPDSKGSSLHSTPNSAGVHQRGVTSPLRLFSPKAYSKRPVLDTVTESSRTPSDGTPDNPDAAAPQTGNDVKSVFSPRPHKVYPASRFSFSCQDAANPDTKVENCRAEESPEKQSQDGDGDIPMNGLSTPKRTKNSVTPPKLFLKLNANPSPVRDENWLINGHCTVTGDYQTEMLNDPTISQNTDRCNLDDTDNEPHNKTPDCALDSKDLGKLKNILSPTAKNCQTPTEQKPLFMFPSPQA